MKKANIIAFLGLFIGLLGILTPIFWDKYKNNSEITVELNSFNEIFGENTPDGLVVTYKQKDLKKLYYISFNIINTGNTPIKGEDIVSPIKIILDDYNAIIEVKINDKVPKDMEVTLEYNKKNGEILSKSVLLNPSDQYSISILTESKNLSYRVLGRITNVKSILTKKNSTIKIEKEKPSKKFIAGAIVISVILSIFTGQAYLREARIKHLLRKGKVKIPKDMNRWATRSYLSRKFSFLESKQDKFSLLYCLDQMPESDKFSEENYNAIILEIEKVMHRTLIAVVSSIAYFSIY